MRGWVAIAGALSLTACVDTEMPGPSEGAQIFAENCAMCHGLSGTGNGAVAAMLARSPSDLTIIT